MRKIPLAALLALGTLSGSAAAQTRDALTGQPILLPSQSSVYNQTGVTLPTPPVAHGQDVVRSAGGTSCQSSVGGSGPYLDVGTIQSNDIYNQDMGTLYGRIVVPLGKRPKRVDCTRLYELEIARLELELEIMRMGTLMAAGTMPDSAGGEQMAAAPPIRTVAVNAPAPMPVSRPEPAKEQVREQPELIEPDLVEAAPAPTSRRHQPVDLPRPKARYNTTLR